MEHEAYARLADHLDRLPGGFAPTETGAELRLLRSLFTPEEAELATRLTLDREDARVIAERASLPVAEVENRLTEMARKGLIFPIYHDDGSTLYQAAPWVVGIYEFQVNNLAPTLLKALADYDSAPRPARRQPVVEGLRTTQVGGEMRTIPINKSIDVRLPVLPYEDIGQLVEANTRYAVAPCICRRHAKLSGEGCDAPEESCLVFGEWADFYSRTGRGRSIDRAEVWAVLERANAANLVLQPTNSRKIAAVCCCCGCCCGILQGLKQHPRPAEAVVSSFIATFEPEECNGCQTCLDRCQMDALTAAGDLVSHNADRCIGCGLCVSTCPTGALQLVRKPDAELIQVPEDMSATWRLLGEARARLE
jgi:Na+-translocating ferredoxin:NAD+ oxidoreductase subunit B